MVLRKLVRGLQALKKYLQLHLLKKHKLLNKKGFLFFELVVSIALFALVTFCLIAPYTFFNKFLVQAEIKSLYSSFYYMQQKAVATQVDIFVRCNPREHAYFLDGNVYHLHKNI